MTERTPSEVLAKVEQIWPEVNEESDRSIYGATVTPEVNGWRIEMKTMYGYVRLTLDRLMALSAFMGTKNIDTVDQYSSDGCDTCDYGSLYTLALSVRPETAND